jgi:hypothetical protein
MISEAQANLVKVNLPIRVSPPLSSHLISSHLTHIMHPPLSFLVLILVSVGGWPWTAGGTGI